MKLTVQLTEEEISKILSEALTKRFNKPVECVTLFATPKYDFRGDEFGKTITANATIGE